MNSGQNPPNSGQDILNIVHYQFGTVQKWSYRAMCGGNGMPVTWFLMPETFWAWKYISLQISSIDKFWRIPKVLVWSLQLEKKNSQKSRKKIDLNNVLLSFTNLYILKKTLKKSTSFSSTTENSRNWRKNFFRAVTSLMFSEIMRNWGCNFLWIFHNVESTYRVLFLTVPTQFQYQN